MPEPDPSNRTGKDAGGDQTVPGKLAHLGYARRSDSPYVEAARLRLALAVVCCIAAGVGQSLTGGWLASMDVRGYVPDWILACSLLFWASLGGLMWPSTRGAALSPLIILVVENCLYRRVGLSLLSELLGNGHLGVVAWICLAMVCSAVCHRGSRILISRLYHKGRCCAEGRAGGDQ